jgi:uncharacterized membrane protein YfcA
VILVAALLSGLLACALLLVLQWRATREPDAAGPGKRPLPGALELSVGFATNFFDTLGIGSFATTTALFRLFRMVPDELIPGTIIVGDALPVVVQALIFISVIDVDPLQMTLLIAACVCGGWIGAGIVASLSRRAIQIGLGCALVAAVLFMLAAMFGWFPAGGTALVLTRRSFAIALAVNMLFGALLTLGIGNYAPSLVLFSMLGMDPRAAFPIMMGSGAFVATIAGVRFVRASRIHRRAALSLVLGGIPAVIVAALVVRSLPLAALRWMVLAVVTYAAVTLLKAGLGSPESTETRGRARTLG